MGRGSSGAGSRKKDKAIIHQSVPDEVLYPNGNEDLNPTDTSWMDSVPEKEEPKAQPAAETPVGAASAAEPTPSAASGKPKPVTRPGASLRTQRQVSRGTQPTPMNDPVPAGVFDGAPNAPAAARAPRPAGWLVIVEGPGEGAWYVLENGVSEIGAAEGQTIGLGFENSGIADQRHAAIVFEEAGGRFYIEAKDFRLNGLAKTGTAQIRDGDVIALGNVSLKLVALTGPNFRWVL